MFFFRKKLPAGTDVTFYDRSFKGDEYKDLSDDKVQRHFYLMLVKIFNLRE